MSNWNMFSQEVSTARAFVRAHGDRYGRYANAKLPDDSYKAQALAELARRLEAEEKIESLRKHINKLIDALEAADITVPGAM